MIAFAISLAAVALFLSGWLVGFAMGWNRSYDVHFPKRVGS